MPWAVPESIFETPGSCGAVDPHMQHPTHVDQWSHTWNTWFMWISESTHASPDACGSVDPHLKHLGNVDQWIHTCNTWRVWISESTSATCAPGLRVAAAVPQGPAVITHFMKHYPQYQKTALKSAPALVTGDWAFSPWERWGGTHKIAWMTELLMVRTARRNS